MSLDTISLWLLGLSAALAAWFMWRGKGWSLSVVFLYMLACHLMELILKEIGRFSDLPYMALLLGINSIYFYVFLNAQCRMMALVLGLDAIYIGINLWFLQNGIQALDSIFGYEGVAVTVLLMLLGTHRGISHQNTTFGDSWNINIKDRFRSVYSSKRANR